MTFSESNVTDLFIVLIGAWLLLRRVGQMERHYVLRVFLLSVVLSSFFLYLRGVFVKVTPYDYDQVSNFGNQY